MKYISYYFNLALAFLLVGGVSWVYAGGEYGEESEIVTSAINGKEYYHLEYVLTKENIVSIDPLTSTQFKINGGQFEVFLNKSMFPIDAPACKSNIILRMPWTSSELTSHELFIDEKYEVYKEIRNAFESNDAYPVHVVIELNPYVVLKGEQFKLTQCNIFFRQGNGRYISYTGSLK